MPPRRPPASGSRRPRSRRRAGRRRQGGGDRPPGEGQAEAARGDPRVRVPVSLLAGGLLVFAAASGRERLRPRDLRDLALGAARHQRPLSPGQLEATASRRWMRRLDHSMIFLLIAGTLTPFALLVLDGTSPRPPGRRLGRGRRRDLRRARLDRLAELGLGRRLPHVGWIGAIAFPSIISDAGIGAGALIAARRRPLHGRRRRLRPPAPRSAPGRLRLPRDLPRARRRRGRRPLRRDRDLRRPRRLSARMT